MVLAVHYFPSFIFTTELVIEPNIFLTSFSKTANPLMYLESWRVLILELTLFEMYGWQLFKKGMKKALAL
jgi:hypothetical protein